MAEFTRPTGIRIEIPDTLRIGETRPRPRGRAPGGLPRGPVALPAGERPGEEGDELVAALQRHGLELVDVVPLEPTVEGTPLPGQRRASAEPLPYAETATIDVDVAANEQAVMLVEQDGVYSWNLPESGEVPQGAAPLRRGLPQQRQVRFRVDLRAQQPAGPATRMGLLGRLVVNRLKAYVLKFAAGLIVEQGVEYLERDSREQLLLVDSLDPAAWRDADTPGLLSLPADRPARILLLVHGTFSSTIGTFGGLTATPWGQQFIQALRSNYDAVLGFDHFTLKRDPAANAQTLQTQLQAIAWPMPPNIDAIAFSRGGLVLRALMGAVPPAITAKMRIRRAVFVACTNDGTILANPDNWRAFIDLYTNLATAACRLMQMLPHATGVAIILKELIQGMASLVKYMVAAAASADRVPGLGAMEPGGSFLGNLHKDGSTGLTEALIYVITSEFSPVIIGAEAEPKELPARLLTAIAEGLVTELMHEANDLVVNASSMATVERSALELVHDRFDFGKTAKVYHTTYFLRPEVVNAVTRWLALVSPEQVPSKDVTRQVMRGKGRPVPIVPPAPAAALPVKTAFRMDLPVMVDTRVLVTRADTPVQDLVDSVRELRPGYVVVKRGVEGATLHYAFASEQVLATTLGKLTGGTVQQALDLHETEASEEKSVREAAAGDAAVRDKPAVVVSDDRVLGVVAPEAGSSSDIVALANAVLKPGDERTAAAAARAMPVFSAPQAAATATLFLRAEMDDSVVSGKATSIDVILSRDAIGGGSSAASGESSGEVQVARKVAVQVIARAEFVVLGEDRVEVDVPAPNSPWTGSFDVKATHPGKGELWVVMSQGPATLSTVILTPTVVEKTARQAKIVGRGAGAEQAAAPAIDQLLIVEQRNGTEIKLFFQLQSTTLNLFDRYESQPLVGDRQAYVKSLYDQIEQRWISTNNDVRNFTEELRELGTDLFTQLLPQELQRLLWDIRDKLKSVLVISTEPFIPWEMMHLKEAGKPLGPDLRFLGQMGVVRWLHQAGYPPTTIRLRADGVRYVIPDYPHPGYALPELRNERQFMEAEFRATAIAPHPSDVRKALQDPAPFDLLHFGCHGEADPANIADARIMLEGRIEGANYVPEYLNTLMVEYSANLHQPDGNRPLVFVNACQLGRTGYKLTGLGGFAQAFLSAGAGVFAGTMWSVGDHPASIFAQSFYRELHNGESLSAATMQAREEARKSGDPSWLAYAVYGHPLTVLRRVL